MRRELVNCLCIFLLLVSCSKEPAVPEPLLSVPAGFPAPVFPADNELTEARFALGKRLFYDVVMSRDSTVSCASCHDPAHAFSDTVAYSTGAYRRPGTRNAPSLTNVAYQPYYTREGGVPTLEMQILVPVQEHNEFAFNLLLIADRLKKDSTYIRMSREAYGRDPDYYIVTRSIACFERTLVSGNSRFDQWKRGEITLTDSEERGRQLFFTEFDPSGVKKGAECFHCHATFNFTNSEYMNNGLDAEADQSDPGRMNVTGNPWEKAMFKMPTLRNVAVTAPYMHDGRFSTLEEVIDHYNTGVKNSPTVDFLMQYNLQPGGLRLTTQDKQDLIAFLKTLTDMEFLSNPAFQSPF